MGFPALGPWVMNSLPDSSRDSHTQPEPNRPTPASTNASLNLSKEPNSRSMALRRSPSGSCLASGEKVKK